MQREVHVGNILNYGGGGRFVIIDIPNDDGGYTGAKFMTSQDGEVSLHVSNSTGDEGALLGVEEVVMKPEEIFRLISLGSHNKHQWVPSLDELRVAVKLPGIVVEIG